MGYNTLCRLGYICLYNNSADSKAFMWFDMVSSFSSPGLFLYHIFQNILTYFSYFCALISE